MLSKLTFIAAFIIHLCIVPTLQDDQNDRVCETRRALNNIARGCPSPRNCQFANPEDCQSYIQCQGNRENPPIQHVMQCPDGLYWNDNTITCEQRSDSTCRGNDDDDDGDDRENDDAVYRRCNHRSEFTAEELEIARLYFINRFANTPIAPKRPPCQRIKVRRDFKCLTHEERLRWINGFKKLYQNDSILNRMTEVHARYWPAWHKTLEAFPSHIKMTNIAEEQLDIIDPGLTFPYWDTFNEGIVPERSMLWDYLGRAGDKKNGYCIRGGYFDDVFLTREQRCIRRQWNRDGSIPGWYPPEFYNSHLQQPNFTIFLTEIFNYHFKVHLFTGGYNGDMAVRIAPNDPAFYLYHNAQYYTFLSRCMQQPDTIMPLALQILGHYDFNAGILRVPSDLANDMMNYFSDTFVAEFYQYGYGEMCSFTDKMVEWALYETSNTRPPLPRSIRRLQRCLSPERFAYWFPAFASGNYSALQVDLYNVGDRNSGQNCRKLPRVENYNDTANSRRQFEALRWEINDVSPYVLIGEQRANAFIEEINNSCYCSPYA